MVDFRRMIPVLAVLAFLLGSAVTASAQNTPFQCFANGGVSTPARAEGLTELVGDFVLNCVGGTPTAFGAQIPQVNVQIFLNTSITSRLLGGSSTLTEGLLLIDEPLPGAQWACNPGNGSTVCPGYGIGTGNTSIAGSYYGGGTIGATNTSSSYPSNFAPLGVCTPGINGVGLCPGNNRNIFQGILTASNSITFLAVPIDPPGTNNRTIRITNIRGNANALGVAGANATPTPIVETISPTPAQFLPVSNPSQTVAFIQRGLVASLLAVSTTSSGSSITTTSGGEGTGYSVSTSAGTALTLQQCNGNRSLSSSVLFGVPVVFLNYKEQFATAFKVRYTGDNNSNRSVGAPASGTAPQQNNLTLGTYNTESGFVNTALSLPSGTQAGGSGLNTTTAGLADWGTRFKAVFNNIPNGVSIYVDVQNTNAGVTTSPLPPDIAILTATDNSNFSAVGAGGSGLPNGSVNTSGTNGGVSPGGAAQLTVTNGSATAIWEEVVSDPTTFASLNFGVYVSYTPSPGSNSPALATTTVNMSYDPTSTVTTANASFIPRFADTSTATNIFTIVPCLTTLLFPFITNQSGFDTGVAISATATDPFGTTPQSGTCTLNWYGTAFTGATPTPTINSGTTFALLVSTTLNNVTGGFEGYMIAVCRFQYAHGFAFISDLGARNLAMGYLALVIPDPTSSGVGRLATPGECGGANNVGGPLAGCFSTGEALTE